MDRWKSSGGKSQRRERKKKDKKQDQRKERVRPEEDQHVRKGRKVAKHCIFPMFLNALQGSLFHYQGLGVEGVFARRGAALTKR